MFPSIRRTGLAAIFALSLLAAGASGQSFTYLSTLTDVGKPTGLSLDQVGGSTFLYVADHVGGRIFRFDLTNGTRTQIGHPGDGDGQFRAPDAIAIDPASHDLYIPDRQLHRVTRLTNNGTFVMKWGGNGPQTNRFGHAGAGSTPGQFNGPQGAVVDSAGNVYVTEHENHRVQKFRISQANGTWSAEVLTTWGSGGSAPGQFNTPYGITLDSAGNVWVADGFNSRLQRFTPNGALLSQIVVRAAGEPHLVATWAAFDPAGNIYVSVTSDPNTGGDIANQRIEKFSPNGASLARWGSNGSGPGQFRLPFGFAIDAATQRAYVADYDNSRVQVFSLGADGQPPPSAPPPTTPPPANPPPTVPPPPAAGGLANVSSRLRVIAGDPNRAAIAGFVVRGANPRPVLIRAVGTGLQGFGVTEALQNPRLQIMDATGRVVTENDDWSNSADMSATADRVGAFRLTAGSRDAALIAMLPGGAYTAHVTSGGGNGIALVEVYDAAGSAGAQSLLNLSTRGFVETGEGQLVAGFVVTGAIPKRLLIRAIGPGLIPFGVVNALADPILRVIPPGGGAALAQNDDWEAAHNGAAIADANRSAGAFALTPGGRDSAVVVTLPAGAYTAVVSGANNGTGTALVEVYELPVP